MAGGTPAIPGGYPPRGRGGLGWGLFQLAPKLKCTLRRAPFALRPKARYNSDKDVVTIAQLAEHLVVAQKVAGSSPAGHPFSLAHVAQPAEQPPCKRSVVGSSPTVGLFFGDAW